MASLPFDPGIRPLPLRRRAAAAVLLFLSFFGYCEGSRLLLGADVTVAISAMWSVVATIAWGGPAWLLWEARGPLQRLAARGWRNQALLFAATTMLFVMADQMAVRLSAAANGTVPASTIIERAYLFAPRAALLSALLIMLLMLARYRRAAAAMATAQPVRPVASDPWLCFAEEPTLRLRAIDVPLIRSAGNYSEIECAGQMVLVRATLSGLADRLAAQGFVRVHRQQLVNVAHVQAVTRGAQGRPAVRLRDGRIVPVGRSYLAALERITAVPSQN